MNLRFIWGRLFAILTLIATSIISIADEGDTKDNDDRADFARWLEKAEMGDADAQFQVALRHGSGRGVEKSEANAAEWFEKAARQGHIGGQRMIALSYQLGRGVEVNKNKAIEWFRKAADQGDAFAQFQLGAALIGKNASENEKNALPWLLKSADNGSREGQHMCGLYYKEGWGGKEDMKSAAYWFEKAAEQNDSKSQREIGICYNFGYGVKRDFDKAFYWFSKAAKQGDIESCRRLGRCYEYGFGTPKDMEQATAWYAEAADKGDEKAIQWLKTTQHATETAQNKVTEADVQAKKARELIEKANQQSDIFVVGGFYIGMPVADAEFLIRFYCPDVKVHSSLVENDIAGTPHKVMENGLWLDEEHQCFCKTDKAAKVIRLNFEGKVLEKFFNYGEISPEKWVHRFIEDKGGSFVSDDIHKVEIKNDKVITVEQPVWRIFLNRGVKMSFFGQEKGMVDESVSLFDFGMVNYMRDYMIQYMNDEGGKVGTLRLE